MRTKLLVIAKAPVPGRAKTRLCPPCSPEQAATIAEAALRDTLDVVAGVDADPIVVLDGPPDGIVPAGMRTIAQRGAGLAERLTSAFTDAGEGPALLIGMDTPQVTQSDLHAAIEALHRSGVDAVLGDAADGGWWAAGFRRFHPMAFAGVPMSTPGTAAAQRERLHSLGLRVTDLPVLRDVDTFGDAMDVAHEVPGSRFARTVHDVVAALAESV